MSTTLSKIQNAFKSLDSEVEKLRDRITGLRQQREDIINADLPTAEARARFAALVKAEAEAFAADSAFCAAWKPDRRVSDLTAFDPTMIRERFPKASLGPLLMWLMPDVIMARFDELLAARAHQAGLPSKERAAAVAKLDAQILELEYEEERIICEAANYGMKIERREDADARAILEVQ